MFILGLNKLGVFTAEMNTVQRRAYRLRVDNLKVAAYMPLRHHLPFGIVYGRPVIPSSSRKTASIRQSPACALGVRRLSPVHFRELFWAFQGVQFDVNF